MKIAILTAQEDSRVAATPETVKKMIALGAEVAVEAGAGAKAGITDAAFADAGATTGEFVQVASGADALLTVDAPGKDRVAKLAAGAKLIGMLNPYDLPDTLEDYASANIDAFAMELMPRITRAQSMDVLSSQANLAGYKAVVDAASAYGRAFPMMMTAAGTVPPAKVFVMGAGVAGLQAIATAKRLGAVVSATDVRYAAKEQVESLGGTFVTVDAEEMKSFEGEGGYAKEVTADFQKRQQDFVGEHLKKMDIVITTALIPGRPAPKLLTNAMVAAMKEGAVLVDLAAPRGGNIEGTEPGQQTQIGGATVLAPSNILNGLPGEASNLYAKNLLSFLALVTDKDEKRIAVPWDDDIVRGVALTRDGAIVHERFGGTPPAAATTSADPEIIDESEA